ncbi:MAG TPA: 4a-hydroxytetrahydrobiopterin dehydratase [Candidatus Elarobacter sp.]|jgi:4a-hydroxytetrahydrobiopterin dehydratase|nr:4a-hydroxytetrahydrobiopterin dehydratase [Candidatus Elarobacter sp.]
MEAPPGWNNDGKALVKHFDRRDFNGAIAFVHSVAEVANRLNHHPDIAISWNDVTIRTWSHDVDAITDRDAALAYAIDEL